jgi:fatty acid desaturase
MKNAADFSHVDLDAFARDVRALRAEADAQLGPEDVAHLRKIKLWADVCSFVGYATAWLLPNPISAFLISQGTFTRWTTLTHHIGHKGYDRVPGIPAKFTSAVWAKGWRRFWDFPDWLVPEGWHHEHNVMHHYHTGDMGDPDLVERDAHWLRAIKLPRWVKHIAVAYFAMTWKVAYYVPRLVRSIQYVRARKQGLIGPSVASTGGKATCEFPEDTRALGPRTHLYNPFHARGRETWLKALLPYALYRFVALPALFLPLGTTAAWNVFFTSLLAELFTNLHTFVVIAPNHAGDDLHRFDGPMTEGRGEFYLRSVLGSVNFRTGTDPVDFMHGWLNYQIEHHVWPDLPMLRLRQLQPRLQAVCAKHGVPYVQESVWRRVGKLVDIMTGEGSMRWGEGMARRPQAAPRTDVVESAAAAP